MATRKPRNTTSTKSSSKSGNSRSARTTARSTVSGPAQDDADLIAAGDALAAKMKAAQALAATMLYNANKASEHGEASRLPQPGQTVKPSDPLATGSTITETNASDKDRRRRPAIGDQSRQRSPRPRARRLRRQGAHDQPGRADRGQSEFLKAGLRGPALLEDFILREKITHFDHERIPERIVHARGSAAHGYFECYKSLEKYTRASLFAEGGKRTPVFVRFSTVVGERGSTDTARDVRGFAVKFYTDEGNWDLVGNNIPMFFIQDAMKFPDLVHAVKPEPHSACPKPPARTTPSGTSSR